MRAQIAAQSRRLEKFSPRITSCRVVVTGPNGRRRTDDFFQVELRIAMPNHKDIVVELQHGDAPEGEHALVIRKAFDAAKRRIEDAERDPRGEVKIHASESHGRMARVIAGEDYGFIETPDGREIYFHRNSVLDAAFDRVSVGAEVRFVEVEGVRGRQASTVRLLGKHHPA